MPSKPMRRRTAHKRKDHDKRDRSGPTAREVAALFDVGPYHRNEVSLSQINRLRDLIDREGKPRAADKVGVSLVTLLSVTSGFGHKLQAATAAKIREYFGG